MEPVAEILVVPFFGQGHLFPSMELCKHLSSRNYQTTLVIPSHLSSSVPSAFRTHPLVAVEEIPASASPPPPPPPMEMAVQIDNGHVPSQHPDQQLGQEMAPAAGPKPGHGPFHHRDQQLEQGIEAFLSARFENPDYTRPACAVIDVMMSWTKDVFTKFGIPGVSFFTSGACSAAMEYAAWKVHAHEMKPGETRILPGLPEDIALSFSDLERRPHRPPPHMDGNGGPPRMGSPHGPGRLNGLDRPHGRRLGPPGPGQPPRWLDEVEGSITLLINTCDDLERLFIDYVTNQIGKPVWGVGPLLPEQFWKSAGTLLRDHDIRSDRQGSHTEDEVIQWLDSKPRGSVIYISFGSEVGPTMEEYAQLANALEESNRPFIWVIQPGSGKRGPPRSFLAGQSGSDNKEEGYYPHGLESKVCDKGLIIRGWAPQLLILSHQSTGGFLSHCGWNSTVEAIGRGVPMLAWPIRGDQFYDAKLVVSHLKMGYMIRTGGGAAETVQKENIVQGIERLMSDEDIRKRAVALRVKFEGDFPTSSAAALDAFVDFISQGKP